MNTYSTSENVSINDLKYPVGKSFILDFFFEACRFKSRKIPSSK